MNNKRLKLLADYIEDVEKGKHAMFMGVGFVVMSREMYDAMVDKMPISNDNPLDHLDDGIDLCREDDEIHREHHEQDKRDFPDG